MNGPWVSMGTYTKKIIRHTLSTHSPHFQRPQAWESSTKALGRWEFGATCRKSRPTIFHAQIDTHCLRESLVISIMPKRLFMKSTRNPRPRHLAARCRSPTSHWGQPTQLYAAASNKPMKEWIYYLEQNITVVDDQRYQSMYRKNVCICTNSSRLAAEPNRERSRWWRGVYEHQRSQWRRMFPKLFWSSAASWDPESY